VCNAFSAEGIKLIGSIATILLNMVNYSF